MAGSMGEAAADAGVRFTTEAFEPRDKLAAFEAAVSALAPQGLSEVEGPLKASLAARRIGPIALCEFRCTKLAARRTARHIAQAPLDSIFVHQQLGPAGSGFAAPRMPAERILPGDLIVSNTDEFSDVLTDTEFHHRAWLAPRSLLVKADVPIGPLERGFRLPRGHGMAAMALTFLDELQRQAAQVDARQLDELAITAVRLLSVASGCAKLEAGIEAGRAGQLVMIKRRIENRLTEPLLSPARVAAEVGISVRKLHALFEPSGESFSQHVLARRLARAQAELSDPVQSGRPITQIAFGLGFNSLSTFYHAYRAAYGEAPGDTRARAVDLRRDLR